MTEMQNTGKRLTLYLWLLLFLLIAYLPLSSFLFALKNDALTANFPNKYFLSAALRSGHLPVWNPYINFGLPLHADPGFAFWNPITWIFGWIGYSVPMLTVEILFYIWIAGISAFELGIRLGHSSRVSFLMGIMYMCSGFFIGNLQHVNFLTCAAFLPLVIKTWLDLQETFTIRNLFFCEAGFYMMATGGHPAIPFACIYFLFFVQAGIIIFEDDKSNRIRVLVQSLRINLFLTLGFLVLTAPLIFSYIEIYSQFSRSAAVIQPYFSDTGFDPASYISFVFPFSTTTDNSLFHNDPLMRNGYFSLAGMICLLIILMRKKNKYQKIFLLAGGAMLILSMGGPVKEILYPLLPLLDHIRTNGEFRVFSLLSFIIAGSFLLTELLEGRLTKYFDRILLILTGISLIIVVYVLVYANSGIHQSVEKGKGISGSIKWFLDTLSFSDRILINAGMLIVIAGLYFLFRKWYSVRILLPLMIMTDLLVFSWSQLPITGVQSLSPNTIQHYFSDISPGIPIPKLEPIIRNQYAENNFLPVIGCWSYYSKQPGTPFECGYPSLLNSTVAYFRSPLKEYINQKPFIYSSNPDFKNDLDIVSFGPSEIELTVRAENQDSLILLQNDYFRWKVAINGKQVVIRPTSVAFMSVPLEKGVNKVRFYYDANSILAIFCLSALLWVLLIVTVLIKKKQQHSNNKWIV